jgi:hypothetical protein
MFQILRTFSSPKLSEQQTEEAGANATTSRPAKERPPPVTMLNAMKLSELLAKNIDAQLYPRIL